MTTKILCPLTLTTALLALPACTREEAARGKGVASAPAAAGASEHAPAGAAPGSYEDWCDEHHVPESLCTRCDPALVPAFKATNDWCEEHGLPESQCTICNPKLKIERPAKKGGG